jgi:hypothetical protein
MRKAALLIALAGVVALGIKKLPGQSKDRRREPDSLSTISVSSCRDISSPGRYVVIQDLTTSAGSCLTIRDTWKVDLNCAGHNISATADNGANIMVTNAQEVGISHCVAHRPKEFNGGGLRVSNSKDVRIIDNDFENVNVSGSLYTYAANNHILGAYYQQQTSWTDFRSNNLVAYSDIYIGACVVSTGGSHNQITENTIDGRWDGTSPPLTQGADDGILPEYESYDWIADNTIQNAFDAGIESAGTLSNTVIVYNNIRNVGNTGIGGWYNNSWQNNVVSGNQVQAAGTAIDVFFAPSPVSGPVPTTVYFQNNSFVNNTFTSPRMDQYGPGASMAIDFLNDHGNGSTLTVPRVLGNNVVTGNILPKTLLGPYLVPSGFIDGGGNVCGPLPAGSFPIVCK